MILHDFRRFPTHSVEKAVRLHQPVTSARVTRARPNISEQSELFQCTLYSKNWANQLVSNRRLCEMLIPLLGVTDASPEEAREILALVWGLASCKGCARAPLG